MVKEVSKSVTRMERWGDWEIRVTYANGETLEDWAASSKGQAFMRRAEARHQIEEMQEL
jgi:hypothetical protein